MEFTYLAVCDAGGIGRAGCVPGPRHGDSTSGWRRQYLERRPAGGCGGRAVELVNGACRPPGEAPRPRRRWVRRRVVLRSADKTGRLAGSVPARVYRRRDQRHSGKREGDVLGEVQRGGPADLAVCVFRVWGKCASAVREPEVERFGRGGGTCSSDVALRAVSASGLEHRSTGRGTGLDFRDGHIAAAGTAVSRNPSRMKAWLTLQR